MKPATMKVLIGIPTGWSINTVWWINQQTWMSQQCTHEVHFCPEPSNTKAVSYSNLINRAIEGDYDGLLIWETNILIEVPLQKVLERCQSFHCVSTPGRFQDNTCGADAIFADDTSQLPSGDIGDGKKELLPFECHWNCTHLVWLDKFTLQKMTVRFFWERKNTKLDHDIPIYCYDGDTWPDHPEEYVRTYPSQGNPSGIRRLAIEQSLFSNVRAQDIGAWADPQLYTTNLRLGGAYRSIRLGDPDVQPLNDAGFGQRPVDGVPAR